MRSIRNCLILGTSLVFVACGGAAEPQDLGGDDGSNGLDAGDLDGGGGGLDDVSFGDGRPGGCEPLTCAKAGANCGPIGDGCGGMLTDCGKCTSPAICGGGGVPSVCGDVVGGVDGGGCVALTCAKAGVNCGPIGDGCGGVVDCGKCTGLDSCGGGGVPSVCGGGPSPDSGLDSSSCTPRTCASAGATCGPIGDGCGGLLDCGKCAAPLICGGGGKASVCGDSFLGPDGATCTPRTCTTAGANCGPIGDGCGGLLDCGKCSSPQICGGGGIPSVCGDPFATADGGACAPRTCATAGATCGPIGDGCGGLIDCGKCKSPQICGGGGTPSVCGDTFGGSDGGGCIAQTCASVGATCGKIGDGCGGTLDCGICVAPDICGGGGKPSVCGGGLVDGGVGDGGIPCTGLCLKQVTCPTAGVTTTVSGTVFAPTPPKFGLPDPLYNAIVYVPNAPVDAFKPGVSCDKCGAAASGSPLVSAITGPDGKFTLKNVPVGTDIPLVIQIGRWRRQIKIPVVTACTNTALTADQTRLPRTKAEGDIPKMAIATGNVDTLECVLRKIGIAEPEFTAPGGGGRVEMYIANGADTAAGDAPAENALWSSVATLSTYDQVLFPCEGAQKNETSVNQQHVIDYTNAGGRVFATHYSYVWLFNDAPFSGTATWKVDQTHPTASDSTPLPGILDVSFPKGKAFSQWLDIVGASTAPGSGKVNILVSRHDLDAVVPPSQRWIYSAAPDVPTVQHYTFNTPTTSASADQCGRVVFSDFHVNDGTGGGKNFPAECNDKPLSAQEKVLEFMLFDLASCVTSDTAPPPPPPTCTKRTCAAAGATCGPVADGCGGLLDCGPCAAGLICGGGGTASVCGAPSCTKTSCVKAAATCGPIGDGCGGTLDCGTCVPPLTCGGGGVASTCGGPSCTKSTCAKAGATCGLIGDGCGGTLDCGTCAAPLTCGGGGTPSTCGGPTCTKITCAAAGASCGPIGDGCGGTLDCGPCSPPDTCGGGGTPSVCGHSDASPCTPRGCSASTTCGPAADGCGGLIDCGTCTPPETCGGGGVPGACGGPKCTPRTCASVGANCGPLADGCGALLDCGKCAPPATCGGAGTSNVCGGGSR